MSLECSLKKMKFVFINLLFPIIYSIDEDCTLSNYKWK